MSDQSESSALTRFGPVGIPALGLLVAVGFVVVGSVVGSVQEPLDRINAAITGINDRVKSRDAGLYTDEEDARLRSLATGPRMAQDAMAVGEDAAPAPDLGDQRPALDFPLQFKIDLEVPEMDEFQVWDTNGDEVVDKGEFSRATGKYKQEDFDKWDHDKSGEITRQEWEKGEAGGGGTIDNPPDEVTEFDLAPVPELRVFVDTEKLQITVRWSSPSLTDAPEDLCYIIERYCPLSLEQRRQEYRSGALRRYTDKSREWDEAFREWWTDEVKQTFPRKTDAQKEFAKTKPRPVMPPEPTEWEVVAVAAGEEYTDSNFQAGLTYTYAVRAATQKDLKKGVASEEVVAQDTAWKASSRSVQTQHPVVVSPRLSMAWTGGGGGSDARIRLSQWVRVETTGGGIWRRVEVELAVPTETEIGGLYSGGKLKDLGAKAYDSEGNEASDFFAALGGATEVDFRTNWKYIDKIGSNELLLEHLTVRTRKFHLPRDTRNPPEPAQDPADLASMENPIEVRALSVASSDARLELTRWVQEEGGRWFRVVVALDVEKGKSIGGSWTVSALRRAEKMELVVYDDGGKQLGESEARALDALEVDLDAGLVYKGVSGRALDLDGDRMDLFGVWYVDK